MLTDVNTETKYVLPPEWSTQSGVMLTWPHQDTIWAATLADIDKVFVLVTKEIAKHEKVVITCFDNRHQAHIKKLLQAAHCDLNHIKMYLSHSNDIWVRDHGPMCVFENNLPVLLDFIFNGWGNKYPADFDNTITHSLYTQKAFGTANHQAIDLVLEGGAIEIDGAGTLLTTTQCLLSRNPEYTKEHLTQKLIELFGVKQVIWLEHGYLAGDDTDGHIDTLARFVNPHTICYVSCDDPNDENYASLKAMEQELQTLRNIQGKPYNLIALPSPKPRYAKYDGRRLPLNYVNFLIINNAVLVPIYNDEADQIALNIYQQVFPNREIIGIDSSAAIEWYGAIHCFTMQLPMGVL